MPPFRYFVYVLGTVNALMAALFLGWSFAGSGPGPEVIIPVVLVVTLAGAWSVVREFSRPV